jgi:hypothetical protein
VRIDGHRIYADTSRIETSVPQLLPKWVRVLCLSTLTLAAVAVIVLLGFALLLVLEVLMARHFGGPLG